MGKLGGFSYRELVEKLRKFGFEFLRSAKGDHEIWYSAEKNLFTTIPHHKEIKEGTLTAILKQCKISIKDFLEV